ncbi:Protein aubergine, partial [Pseudolycoriella hygida]
KNKGIMTGRGRSRGQAGQQQQGQTQSRTGGGRGRAQQTPLSPQQQQGSQQSFVPAPAPTVSAWGRPAPQSAAAPPPAQSAWGRPGPQSAAAPPPAQSAWGRPAAQQTSAPVVQVGLPAFRGSGESRARGRPIAQQPAGPSQAGPSQAGPSQAGPSQAEPSSPARAQPSQRERGNGAPADRGAIRGRAVISDIIRTKPEGMLTKIGNVGAPVPLKTNYFRLLKKPNWQIYQYRVDFSPNIVLEGLRNRLIFEQKATLGGYLFDGTMLFLTVKLRDEVTQFMSKDKEENPIQTTIKFVGLVSMMTASSVQILNLILRRSMGKLNLQMVGRNFFDSAAKITLNQYKLQLWPGYLTSIRQHETDILLCAEVTTKVMRTETIHDIMVDCHKNERNFQTAFTEIVVGMTVLTEFNKKTYKISEVDYSKNPRSTFMGKNGEISFADYYLQKHKLRIKDMNQPLLASKSSNRKIRGGEPEIIMLIPELCSATGLTQKMRNDGKLMAALANHTRLAPKVRIEKYIAFNQRLQTTKESVENFNEWNFKLDTNFVNVSGRVLPNETILFGKGKSVLTNQEADWSREFRNITMYVAQDCNRWVLIAPNTSSYQAPIIKDFLSVLQQASRGMNYRIGDPQIINLTEDNGSSYARALDQAASKDPQLIMAILPNNNSDRYSIIKKKLCDDRAIPSQVMCIKTITPKPGRDKSSLLTVGTKVAIQINCKLGGAPWMVQVPVSKLMVVGYDVCHDTKDKSRSYGALVATMDMRVAQNYFSAVTHHSNGEEMSNNLALNMQKAVRTYAAQHKYLPERIFFYRDGVGEGQTNYVFQHEIQQVRNALDKVYEGQPYKFIFIVVSKRINTRFFKGDANPSPGTVVDDIVTMPERYDFFLVAQSVRQGTVSPTSYNILFDGSTLTPGQLQQFTYKMTHLYYNWSGTLAVPSVCQYAHKLAYLVGNYIHRSPSAYLEKKLYFL